MHRARTLSRWIAASSVWLAALVAHAEQEPPPDTEGDAEEMRRHDASMEALGDDEARSHFRIARTLYDEGRFREAAQEFESAYRLSNRPGLLFNMYIAYRDAGVIERAAEALREYIERQPGSPERNALLVRLRAMEETLDLQSRSRDEDIAPSAPDPEPAAEEPAPAPLPPPAEKRSPTPFIVGGIGAALLGVAAVTGVVALNRAGAIDDACPGQTCPASFPLDDKRRDARTMVIATDALLVAGAALVTTGVILYFVGRKKRERNPNTPTMGAACAPTGCAAEMRLAF